jgi:hypothetical protein
MNDEAARKAREGYRRGKAERAGDAARNGKAGGGDGGRTGPGGLKTTRLNTMSPKPLDWLVPGYLPLGKLALLAGDGGHGKSTLTLALAAAVTTGKPAFGLNYEPPPPGDVLLISCEDDFEDTVVPRLLAAGADMSRICRVDGTHKSDGKVNTFSFAHFQEMEEELERQSNVCLVVIDPAGAYIGRAGCDDHKDSELRALLEPMSEVAARRRVTFLLVKHINRNVTAKAVHRVTGSSGYVNTVRAAFLVAADPEDKDRRLFLPLKANLAPEASGFAYRLQGLAPAEAEVLLAPFADLREEDRQRLAQQFFRPEWLGRVDITADEALAAANKKARDPNKVDRCAEWMRDLLSKYAYPSDEIVKLAIKAGFTKDNYFSARPMLKEDGLRSWNQGRFQGQWWTGFGSPDTWTIRPVSGVVPETKKSPETPGSPETEDSKSGVSGDPGDFSVSGTTPETGNGTWCAPGCEDIETPFTET